MALPFGPLLSLMFSTIFMIMLVKFHPGIALFAVLASALIAGFMFAYRGNYLPRFIMDVLARLSDKKAIEESYDTKRRSLVTIDSEELAANIKARVIGQDRVVDSIAVQLRRRIAANRPGKPIGVFCFAGPPGVGKTHLAKVLAEELYGNGSHLQFFDMSQYGLAHASSSLFGQARGYVGSNSYGALTAALRDRPNAIYLLDEFEKANPEVHKRFLTAWNDGFVTELSDGSKVSTSEAIFILTTNAASRQIGEIASEASLSEQETGNRIKKALGDAHFAPEVLSRIDEVFAFHPLEGLDIARVVALEIEILAKQYGLTIAEQGIDPRILVEAIEKLKSQTDGGARDIARAIERKVTDKLLDARAGGATAISLVARGDQVEVVPVIVQPDQAPTTLTDVA